jgi:peptidoglycan/LPS O-acetylase OafA/YrhL
MMNESAATSEAVASTEMTRLLERGLSTRARYGHVLLLLAALAMSIVVAALMLTEPALPARTQAAFAVMLLIGLGWAAYAVWVLRHRWTLLAGHRVIAAIMAVTFAAVFTAAAAVAAVITAKTAAWAAAASGAVLVTVAAAILVRAIRHRHRLEARRAQLERELGAPS